VKREIMNGWLAVCVIASAAIAALPSSRPAAIRLEPPAGAIPPTFFGMHIHYFATSTPWPPVSFGSIRLWDAYVTWPRLEPKQGVWDFTALDKYVDAAQSHHADIVLPLGLSPEWVSSRPDEKSAFGPGNAATPARLEVWRDYVRAIATRYKGRIFAYEIWNEPNMKQFYSGSVEEMLQLAASAYPIIKQIDPQALVCSPSATNRDGVEWLDRYLQQGGGKYADVIGFHFYANPDPPETALPLIQQVRDLLRRHDLGGKPLWNTETGWAISNRLSAVQPAPAAARFNSVVLSEEQASAYLARMFVLNWAEGIQRLYWYSWDNKTMGLTEADGKTLKEPAHTYAVTMNWLLGARMLSCGASDQGLWTCQILRPDGSKAWIVWSEAGDTDFRVPADWNSQTMHDLHGGERPIVSGGVVRMTSSPVLFETGGHSKNR
jgi:hypothetical protein